MQVLPRLNEEIIKEDNNDNVETTSPTTFPTPTTAIASTTITSTNPSIIATTTTTTGEPNDIEDDSYDLCDDSDTEAPLGWKGVTKDTLQEGQIIKAGYLMKKGERLKIWKKKWFVLRTSKLAYYKDSKEYELLRITDIRDVHKAAEVPVKHKSGVFVILTPRRTVTVQAKDVAEMRDWVQAINQAKVQFDFTASSSDLESYAGSTAQLGCLQQDGNMDTMGTRPLQQQQQPQPTTRQEMILPRRQQHKPLSLSDPDLLDKREKSRIKGKGIALSTPTSATPQSPVGFPGSSVANILDRPTPRTGGPRAGPGLTLVTSTQAMQISSPSSPRMEQVHSTELPVGSFSSDQSNGANAVVPETPSSPGGYYSGGEAFWSNHDHNMSSGEEDVADDPSILEAGRLASEVNAPGSGIVTDEQLGSKLVRQGYLYKLGNKYKTWRKKWFVLRGDKLIYYKNTKEYQPHGIIPLSTIIDCLQMDPVSKSRQYCLRIVTVKRSFVCSAPDEDTLLQWLDALHVECDRVAHEAQQEEIADNQAHQQQGSGSLHDGHEDDDEQQAKQLGRTARLKLNLHSSLPRTRSKSGDGTGLFGSSANSTGAQIRKVLSLDSSGGTPLPSPSTTGERGGGGGDKRESLTSPNVTFQIPTISEASPGLPTPGTTVTFSA
ncbi:hypothetical protein BGZ80_011128 [Entomortierella chlamydospora]|uniref:PH domain-containing protein n=1 Tax=Entomortierella chlamydospora TaxID=101097 RepID=A0A9P6MUL0_9FUNG|nr:hypothetical protein BGZ80_011128 [Entomortierella chlamydospora]